MSTYRSKWALFRKECGVSANYYAKYVGNMHFIVLGGDEIPDRWDHGKVSAAQLSWLDAQLTNDENSGRMSYIYFHYPLYNTVQGSLPEQESGYSINDNDALWNVLSRHRNAIFFSGHSHYGLDVVRKTGSSPLLVNTGAIGYDSNYGQSFSQGWYVYVFGGHVVLKGRDFLNHCWLQTVTFSG